MYYAKREDNFRMRSLKYARKYMHVEAMCWGPVTVVNSGFVALQNITDRVVRAFQIIRDPASISTFVLAPWAKHEYV